MLAPAGSPAGLGRSVIVDPEGRVREYGTAGVSRLWEQAQRSLEPPFPLG